MNISRMDRMRQLLAQAIAPQVIEIRDDSHLHIGHEGARGGAGHYHVRIVAAQFAGRSRVQRHQVVYAALAPLMHAEIHALGIDALTPDEFAETPHSLQESSS